MFNYIYISGFGRSGSTVVEQVLCSEFEHVIGLGEISYFFERGLSKSESCSCQNNVFECEFWSNVIDDFGKNDLINNAKFYSEISSRFERTLHFYKYFFLGFDQRKNDYSVYISVQKRLINSIIRVSKKYNCVTIIDSSKFPTRGWQLYKNILSDDINFYNIHLIRNPIATAYSWGKKLKRKGTTVDDVDEYMNRFSFSSSILKWVNANFASSLFSRKVSSVLKVSYENFVGEPKKNIELISEKFNLKVNVSKNIQYHSVSGNPSRMSHARISDLKIDNEWETGFSSIKIYFWNNFINLTRFFLKF